MAEHESESGATDGAAANTSGESSRSGESTASGQSSSPEDSTSPASTSAGTESHGAGNSSADPGGSESSSATSRASAAFAAGRAERKDKTSDGGVGANGEGGPSEAPTVDHRTEVMGASGAQQGAPTTVQPRPEVAPQADQAPRRSGPSAVGGAVRRVLNLLATLVAIVGLLCAIVLVLFVVLRVVAINPQNVVAQAVDAIADRLVGPFRDLFLIPDPVVGLAVNYGLAALCWLVAGLIVARILRAVGRAVP